MKDEIIAHYDMAPAPWDVTADKDWIYSTVGVPNGGDIICIQPDMEDSRNRFPAIAAAIVTAVNATYGQGINPEAVPDMLDALKALQGMQVWITDNRMKELFISKLYPAIEKSSL